MSVEAQLVPARPRQFLRVASARLAAHGSLRCGEGMPPPSRCSCAPSEPSRQTDRVGSAQRCRSTDPTAPAAMMLPTRSSSQTAQASTARSVRPRWRCRCAINAAEWLETPWCHAMVNTHNHHKRRSADPDVGLHSCMRRAPRVALMSARYARPVAWCLLHVHGRAEPCSLQTLEMLGELSKA